MLGRLLSRVGVLAAHINFQFSELLVTKTAMGQHTAHGFLDDGNGASCSQVRQIFFFETTRETGMVSIKLLGFFLAGDLNLLSIEDNDEVAAINVRCELRLMFASQKIRHFNGQASEGFSFGIYDEPLSCDFLWFRAIGFHSLYSSMVSPSFQSSKSKLKEPEMIRVPDRI